MGWWVLLAKFLRKWARYPDDSYRGSNCERFGRVDVMSYKQDLEQTATSITSLGRDELKRRIKNFRGRFQLDFTETYLDGLSVDRLRHILLAALINARPH